MRALLEACSGQDFEDRRDSALLMTLIETGARASEVVGSGTRRPTLKPTTLIWTRRLLRVTGKGNRVRGLAIGRATVKAWDRYVRVRARRRDADLPGSGWAAWAAQMAETAKSAARSETPTRSAVIS